MKINLLFLFIACLYYNGYSQLADNHILAAVGDHQITLTEFNERYSNFLFSTGAKDNMVVRKSVLDNIINEILLYNYDSNEKILTDSGYLKELEDIRMRMILAYLKDQEVYAKITVSEQEMRQAFSRVNEQIAARHLFAQTEEEANNLYELVNVGVDFSTLAKQVFTDSILQNNGGYLGYFTWGDMDPAFEDAAYALKVGEISPPVKTEYGYSIIKLEDRISNPLLTESEFQRKKAHLETVIKMRKKEPSEKEYLNNILDESKINFNENVLANILGNLYSIENAEFSVNNSGDEQCVEYSGRVYTQAEIEKKISDLSEYQRKRINSLENLEDAIEGLILRDSLYNIALSKGYDTTQVVLDKIQKSSMNAFIKFKRDEIVSEAQIPDSVVYNFYTENIYLFSTEPEINLQEILVSNKEMANNLINLLNKGSDFGELANEYSLREWSAKNNGIMGYAPISKFGSYKDIFWNSQVGEIIGPVKIEGIYGIFRLLGKEDGKPLDFDDVKSEVIKASQFENKEEILYDYILKIRGKINLWVDEDMLYSDEIVGLNY